MCKRLIYLTLYNILCNIDSIGDDQLQKAE